MTHDISRPSQPNPAPGLLLAATLLVMAVPTVSPALPGLAEKFSDTPYVDLITRYLVAAPSLMALLFAPFTGRLSDRIGHGLLLRLGSLLFGLSGAAGLFLDRLDLILLSRFVLGLCLAMVVTSQTALIGEFFQGEARQKFLGWQVSARNFGGLFFVLIAGVAASFSPHYPFAIYGLTFLFLPFIWKATAIQIRTKPPQHNAPSLRSTWLKPVYGLCLLMVVVLTLFFIMPSQIPFALQDRGFADPALTGYSIGALMIVGAIAGALYGKIVVNVGEKNAIGVGFAFMTVGFSVLLSERLIALIAGPSLIGAGYAILMASGTNIALSLAPAEHRGVVMGLASSAVFLGQSLSPLISTPLSSAFGFTTLFILAGIASLICAVGAVLWPKAKVATQEA